MLEGERVTHPEFFWENFICLGRGQTLAAAKLSQTTTSHSNLVMDVMFLRISSWKVVLPTKILCGTAQTHAAAHSCVTFVPQAQHGALACTRWRPGCRSASKRYH